MNPAEAQIWRAVRCGGAFNSVAEYTDYMMLCEDSTTRLNAIWFGRGEQLKLKAFYLAEQMLMCPESGIQATNKAGVF